MRDRRWPGTQGLSRCFPPWKQKLSTFNIQFKSLSRFKSFVQLPHPKLNNSFWEMFPPSIEYLACLSTVYHRPVVNSARSSLHIGLCHYKLQEADHISLFTVLPPNCYIIINATWGNSCNAKQHTQQANITISIRQSTPTSFISLIFNL